MKKGGGVFVLGSVCCSARSGSAALRCSPGLTLLPHHQLIMLVLNWDRAVAPPLWGVVDTMGRRAAFHHRTRWWLACSR
jgi:hypothetical protein